MSKHDEFHGYDRYKTDSGREGLEESREAIVTPNGAVPGCPTCALPDSFKPSHYGSKRCESGSLASGGTHAHCSCDTCF